MTEKIPMLQIIANWFRRNFSDPEAIGLFFTIVIVLIAIEIFGNILLPVFISIGIAYLLNALVVWLERWHFPRLLAIIIIYTLFIGLYVLLLFYLVPLLWKQLANLVNELPTAFTKSQEWAAKLMQKYPNIFTDDPFAHVTKLMQEQASHIGQAILSYSLASIPSIIEAIIYFILVPVLTFFLLKDGEIISGWITRYLPSNRGLVQTVWFEFNEQVGAYVKGRVIEVIIIGIVSVIAFKLLGLQYAVLVGAVVGLSVLVPYIGAVIATIPIVVIGLMQWGFSAHFSYLILAFFLIVFLDGYVLFPLLFSETIDLHPAIIILAVLIFGGIWGFWGVFLAVPIASLVRAILDAWPQVPIPEKNKM